VAPLFIEVENRLAVRHASVLSGYLSFEPTNFVPFFFLLTKVREVAVKTSDGGLCGLRVQFTEHRLLAFPLGEFVVLVVLRRLILLWGLLVVPADVIVELAMNVKMVFQFNRYLLRWVGVVAVTVLNRCFLISDVFN
jgi:hypothetical protein